MASAMSKKSFAERHKVHPGTVSKWIARGIISPECMTRDGLVIVDLAEARLRQLLDPMKSMGARNRAGDTDRREACQSEQPECEAGEQPDLVSLSLLLEAVEHEVIIALSADPNRSLAEARAMTAEIIGGAWPRFWCEATATPHEQFWEGNFMPPRPSRDFSRSDALWAAVARLRDEAIPPDGIGSMPDMDEVSERVSDTLTAWGDQVRVAWAQLPKK